MYTTEPMWRNVLAVLFGYAITGILVVGTDQLFAFAIDGFDKMIPRPAFYFAISIVTTTVYSIVGGWTCAAIAKTRIRPTATALVILGELMGVASTVFLWKTVPHYYSFALLILYPPAVWFGAKSFEWTRPVKG